MTTTVLLIRHASHDRLGRVLCGRMAGVTLSESGRQEAMMLAAAIERRASVGAVYSSPLARARETAAALSFGVEVDEDLNELDFGAWSGVGFDDLRADPRWADWNRRRDQARPPQGETMLEGQGRVVRCLERLHRRHPGATVAAVSHAEMIKLALAWILGLPLAFHARFEVSPASVSRVQIGDANAAVWSVNETLPS